MFVYQAIDIFIKAKQAENLSNQTIQSYSYRLNIFGSYVSEKNPPGELPREPTVIEDFLIYKNSTPETVDTYFRLLRNFYRFLNRRGEIDFNPLDKMAKPKLPRKVVRSFTQKELRQILNYPGHRDHDRAFLWLLASTGMRVGEALSVTEESFIDGVLTIQGKTGQRLVPMDPRIWKMVEYELPWVWNRRESASEGIKKAIKRAGVTGNRASAHTLRHTFCRLWNHDLQSLVGVMGWTTNRMLDKYKPYDVMRAKHDVKKYLHDQGMDQTTQLNLF